MNNELIFWIKVSIFILGIISLLTYKKIGKNLGSDQIKLSNLFICNLALILLKMFSIRADFSSSVLTTISVVQGTILLISVWYGLITAVMIVYNIKPTQKQVESK